MAQEILILSQRPAERGTDYTYAALLPARPRIVDGQVVPYTPTSTLEGDFLRHLTPAEKAGLDDGTLIFHIIPTVYMPDGHTDAQLERRIQLKYSRLVELVPERYENADRLVGKRFDGVRRGEREGGG